jgi:hypothetical protein
MQTRLYKGSELADFNEAFNVMFSIGDVRNLSFGCANRTYTLDLPNTKTNRRLLKHIQKVDVTGEPNDRWSLFLGEQLIISGNLKIIGNNDYVTRVIIDSDEWIDALKDKKLASLSLTEFNHALTASNVENSWSASDPAYRYPMIDFGALMTGETGSLAKWFPADFIPMISVKTLFEKIISPYTISSLWLQSDLIKNLFILGRETIAPEAFLKNKAFSITAVGSHDNDHTGNVLANSYFNVSATFALAGFETDEGDNYSADKYTVPETGSYRFELSVKGKEGTVYLSGITVTSTYLRISIMRNGAVIARAESTAITDTLSVDTSLIHCTAGDIITSEIFEVISGDSTHDADQTLYIGVDDGVFKNIGGNTTRYAGIGQTRIISELLPDMTQVDFLAAIRDVFNLRFWTDKRRQKVYIEPWDKFLSSTVIDITDLIDFQSFDTEFISSAYNKNIVFRWKDDEIDAAYKEYLKYNTNGPGKKELQLKSEFAKRDIGYIDHPFSSLIMGYMQSLGNYNVQFPRIFNELPIYPFIMFDRKTGFNTRLVEWKGLTAGLSWNYNGTIKTSYPKIQPLDWNYIYSAYWMKFMHYIDKGKLLTVKMKVKPGILGQFFTVIDTAENEGFRPTYKIRIKGVDNYFFMQKITSDGLKAECEFILKQ